jgi:hypothetical protein
MKSAAQCVYPHLAYGQEQPKQSDRAQLGRPAWGRSNEPMWSEPPPIPNGLDRVPGLRRVNRK